MPCLLIDADAHRSARRRIENRNRIDFVFRSSIALSNSLVDVVSFYSFINIVSNSTVARYPSK